MRRERGRQLQTFFIRILRARDFSQFETDIAENSLGEGVVGFEVHGFFRARQGV